MSIVKAFFGLGKTPRVMKFFEFQSFDDVNGMGGLITQIKNQVQKEGLKLTKAQQKFLDDQMEQVKLVFEKMQNKPDRPSQWRKPPESSRFSIRVSVFACSRSVLGPPTDHH